MRYDITVHPSKLSGSIVVPPSKSQTHRAILCAGMAEGKSVIEPFEPGDDIQASLRAIEALGAKIKVRGKALHIKGRPSFPIKKTHLHVGKSASTLRFFIPISMIGGQPFHFTMDAQLAKRPLEPYHKLFPDALKQEGDTLTVHHSLTPGDYVIDGSISSQFVSGLLFALPLLKEQSTLRIEKITSTDYIDLTVDILETFGIVIIKEDDHFRIPGNQTYFARTLETEGDYGLAANLLVAGLKNTALEVYPLKADSSQADRLIVDFIKAFEGKIIHTEEGFMTSESNTRAATIDIDPAPDLAPITALLGAYSEGTTEILNTKRLQYKESNRIISTVTTLKKLGFDVLHQDNRIIIKGLYKRFPTNKTLETHGDHRIVMMAVIGALNADKPITITNAQVVEKSYPRFYDDLISLGAKIDFKKITP